MTQDEIIRMAREAGFFAQELHCSPPIIRWSGDEKQLERFAALVAAHEREKFCSLLRQVHDSISLASDPSGFIRSEK